MTNVAVVTGGASGIGRRTVERLLAEGWSVWSLDRAEHDVLEDDVPPDTRARYKSVACDVSKPESVAHAFSVVKSKTDRIRALICSAGVDVPGALEDVTPADVNAMISVNVTGPWLCVREALSLLRKDSTVTDPARVVIVGSIGGIRPKVGNGMYSATKAAVHVLAGIFAVELAESGVIVNVVAPGTVRTPMIEAVQQRAGTSSRFNFSGASPLGRIAEADDISDVILFYLSDAAKYVNGTVLPVDGGTRAAFVKS